MEKFSYLNRPNLEYIDDLYQRFLKDPETVGPEWRLFFDGVEFAHNLGGAQVSQKELDVYNLIKAYRDYGHYEAHTNPLSEPKAFPQLQLAKFNLNEKDLDEKFRIGAIVGKPNATLREIIQHLRGAWCGTLTAQFASAVPDVREWFVREFEQNAGGFKLAGEEKKDIFHSLARTESLEKFLHTRWVGAKRFSVEGADALLPMLEALVTRGTRLRVEEIVIGMAHRGRINVLANFMGKALEVIFAGFDNLDDPTLHTFDGDVKYHLGYSADKVTPGGNCHISLAFNPSHLEAVNPVVQGMARAKQRRRKNTQDRDKVVPVLIHGDAAFAGQGVVAEIFQMSQLKGYTVGGTVHICIDNQVGFTADPDDTRSSPYASDISKILQTPVLHVNGDDVEACVRAMDIALRFRQQFKRDIVINQLCYRRFGHNEGDEPAFTQPLMYEKIKGHPTLLEIYGKRIIADGTIDQNYFESYYRQKFDNLQAILDETRKNPPKMKPVAFEGVWKGLHRGSHEDMKKDVDTRVGRETLLDIGKVLTTVPNGFNIHPKIARLLDQRAKMLEGEGQLDWGMAELLSYGSLLKEGTPIRISGQDCIRGTFSHRHSAWYDAKTGERYSPLTTIKPNDAVEFCVYDSLLSEYGVLGFEYGNSSSDPSFLTIWEAQFGDFANGAQIIIDQFLSSGEQKWQRMSGLTLLLPHGYEGGGPEHSSARLERFLQMCAQDNWQVCNLTTPAQIFHVFRRQMKRDFRKPLIIMSPKSLLRHPEAVSSLKDLTDAGFQEVIADTFAKDLEVETAILCSGKLYYELAAERKKLDPKAAARSAILRVEQLYPFPDHKLAPLLRKYMNLKTVIWAQEEPKNMGGWSFAMPRLHELLNDLDLNKVELKYVGRTERASPATGSPKVHTAEQSAIVQGCFNHSQKK